MFNVISGQENSYLFDYEVDIFQRNYESNLLLVVTFQDRFREISHKAIRTAFVKLSLYSV